MRAIAALSIVVYHVDFFAPTANAALGRFVHQLRSGVWIFFVLSGFLLYRPFAAADAGGRAGPSVRGYLWRRALRVLPAYWTALVVLTYLVHSTRLWHGNVGDAFTQFGLVQVYTRDGAWVGLPQTWSLAVEVSFYAYLPLHVWAVDRVARHVGACRAEGVGLAVVTAFGAGWMFATRNDVLRQQWLPNFLVVFAAGMALAVFVAPGNSFPRSRRACERAAAFPLACWAVAVALLVVRSRFEIDLAHDNSPESQVFYLAFVLLIVLPVVFGGERRDIVRDFLRTRVLVFLGTISYGIFLWHYYLIVIVQADWFGWQPDEGHALVLLVIVLALTIAISTLSWNAIERPALALARAHRR